MNQADISQVVSQLRAMAAAAGGQSPQAVAPDNGVDFSSLLKNSINKVNETQQSAGALAKAFETGDPNINLEQVMVALQKSNISFQAMTQVRNKLVSAYQEIMSMPV
ncbi:MAG: flagellar hook-basal body complex protein FliE [Gammaproteobacteria bacterium]|nr:MAG: flagellar hook-basal body complex protein FliE [Gammaproteobacteria bacterium]